MVENNSVKTSIPLWNSFEGNIVVAPLLMRMDVASLTGRSICRFSVTNFYFCFQQVLQPIHKWLCQENCNSLNLVQKIQSHYDWIKAIDRQHPNLFSITWFPLNKSLVQPCCLVPGRETWTSSTINSNPPSKKEIFKNTNNGIQMYFYILQTAGLAKCHLKIAIIILCWSPHDIVPERSASHHHRELMC